MPNFKNETFLGYFQTLWFWVCSVLSLFYLRIFFFSFFDVSNQSNWNKMYFWGGLTFSHLLWLAIRLSVKYVTDILLGRAIRKLFFLEGSKNALGFKLLAASFGQTRYSPIFHLHPSQLQAWIHQLRLMLELGLNESPLALIPWHRWIRSRHGRKFWKPLWFLRSDQHLKFEN